jgi:transketolase
VRDAFVAELCELAERDPRVVLLTGDLGFTVVERFRDRFPDRFINVGVAEQNMVGLATGLAESGLIPFVYSIATFASMRPYEFIRNGPALHELPVRITGVGGGFDYGVNGITHYALEDIALMRTQPGITSVAPADPAQAAAALATTWELPRPVYYRLGKQNAALPTLGGSFELGRLDHLRPAGDLAIVALGTAAITAMEAAEELEANGLSAGVSVVTSFNPTPSEDLAEVLEAVPVAVTVEAHYASGGLGSAVAEVVADRGIDCRLVRCAVAEVPKALTGSRDFLHQRHGIDGPAVARRAMEALAPVGN